MSTQPKSSNHIPAQTSLWSQLPDVTRHRLANLIGRVIVQLQPSGLAQDPANAKLGAGR